MFWDKYVALCVQHGESPNSVARSLSISSGSVTKWKNGAVPRAGTLKRIADYFGVDVGELVDVYIHLSKFDLQMVSAPEKKGEEKEKSAINDATPHISLTPEEQLVIMRYRSVNPDTRAVIRKILDVPVFPLPADEHEQGG